MNIVLYARVSTEHQAERDLSIPAQFRALHDFAREGGHVVVAEFQDVGSGRSFRERTGLLAAIKRCQTGHDVQALVAYRFDRIGRDLLSYLALKEKLKRHGVTVISIAEHTDDTPLGTFMEELLGAQAELYSANLAVEVKRGIDEALEQGRWVFPVPAGYVKRDKHVELDPTRAPLIAEVFKRFATGSFTTPKLARWLKEVGYVTRKGRFITPTHLCALLHNPFYAGILETKGEEHEKLGNHPPLVDVATFRLCQKILHQRSRRMPSRPESRSFLLSRRILCPRCHQGHLVGENHTKGPGRPVRRYYRCHVDSCRFNLKAEGVEEAVVKEVEGYDESMTAWPVDLLDRVKAAVKDVVIDEAGAVTVNLT